MDPRHGSSVRLVKDYANPSVVLEHSPTKVCENVKLNNYLRVVVVVSFIYQCNSRQ